MRCWYRYELMNMNEKLCILLILMAWQYMVVKLKSAYVQSLYKIRQNT